MNYADWSTLKTASKVAFKKIAAVAEVKNSDGDVTTHAKDAYIVLEQKRYDANTGAEIPAKQTTISLADLESKKSRLTKEKATIQAELTEVGKMITQIKKV